MKEERDARTERRWGRLVGLIGLVLTALGIVIAVLQLQSRTIILVVKDEMREVSGRVDRVEKRMLQADFRITYPEDGALVDVSDFLKGQTPFKDMNNYVVITPVKTGEDYVQDVPVTLFSGGTWTARARFGAAGVGAGEQFVVRLLATRASLAPGPLTVVPEDGVFADSIVVTRKP